MGLSFSCEKGRNPLNKGEMEASEKGEFRALYALTYWPDADIAFPEKSLRQEGKTEDFLIGLWMQLYGIFFGLIILFLIF